MTSNKPLSDRCGAKVTNKTGLEICGQDDLVVTDQEIARVRLTDSDGEISVDAEPAYHKLREYLWDDYETTHVACTPTENVLDDMADIHESVEAIDEPRPADTIAGSPSIDSADCSWYTIDGVDKTTNRFSELVGYCERYKLTDEERCYVHQGGGGPKNNTNAMTHGLYAQRTNFYQALNDDDKHFVEAMVDAWMEMSDYDRDNIAILNELYRCAIDQLRAWSGIEEYEEDGEIEGLTKEITIDYDPDTKEEITAEGENPVNMPYSRLDGDIRSKLRELNIYDSPESQQADATESLAKKLSGLSGGEE